MDIIAKYTPPFLQIDRITDLLNHLFSTPDYLLLFIILNGSLPYTLYNNTFDTSIFVYCYLFCGIIQGFINNFLYYASDILFFGKPVDAEVWKKTDFYKIVVNNSDAIYLYLLGAVTYTSLTTLPESIRWTMVYPGYKSICLQVLLVTILHDIFFALIHYTIHKVKYFRIPHLKWHHECPFNIGNSRCALSSLGEEALLRDLYSGIIPTYILGYFGLPFYGHIWIYYYSFYSFWAMYSHSGANIYHNLHHSKNPNLNYGLYYITDYFMGTLVLKGNENEKEIEVEDVKETKEKEN